MLRERGLPVRRPDLTIGTMDHSTPTTPRNELGLIPVADAMAAIQLDTFTRNCEDYGIPMYALGDEHQGIVHVIGPEKGLTQPGMTIVCGDSHTSTPRRIRRAGFWHWHQRGRGCVGDANALAEQAAHHGG